LREAQTGKRLTENISVEQRKQAVKQYYLYKSQKIKAKKVTRYPSKGHEKIVWQTSRSTV